MQSKTLQLMLVIVMVVCIVQCMSASVNRAVTVLCGQVRTTGPFVFINADPLLNFQLDIWIQS